MKKRITQFVIRPTVKEVDTDEILNILIILVTWSKIIKNVTYSFKFL